MSPRGLATEPSAKGAEQRKPASGKIFVMQMIRPGIVLFRGKQYKLKEIKAAFLRHRKDIADASNRTMVIRAPTNIPASAVLQLVRILQEAGVENYALRAYSASTKQSTDKKPSSRPKPGSAAKVKSLPRSVKLVLKADKKGDLAKIIFNGQSYDSFADVNRVLRNLHQKRPDSVPEDVVVVADYHLKYRNIIAAVTCVTGYKTEDGRVVRLIVKIKFTSSKKPAEKESSP